MARGLIVAVAALLLAIQVVRNAAVAALAETKPASAARLWKGHPEVELSLAMTAIGHATHDRKAVDAGTFAMIRDAAAKAPLAPQPFLVRGVQAQVSGDFVTARRAFEAAERRDPRSLPARFFLADQALRVGDARRGLREFAALARLAPNGIVTVTPFVARYARDPANWPRMRTVFRADPSLADTTLMTLAADPANARAILALAGRGHRDARSMWLQPLLDGMVGAGRFAEARTIWADVAQVRTDPTQLLFDGGFSRSGPPPPFNWALTSSTVGLAERQRGGRLHVIYYGQEDGPLAGQLLMLPPGSYRMTMRISGGGGEALIWSLTCAGEDRPFSTLGLGTAGRREWKFGVSGGCPAQRLTLAGSSSDIPRQIDVTISELTLSKVAPNG
jgi:hypothetical protein